MKDEHKAKEQLINELAEMRRRLAELEAVDTERKRAEEALRESEARYRAVIEDQTELICRFQPDGTLTFVNEAYCRYFGKRREELIGRSCMPLIHEEDREIVRQQMASLSPENPVGSYEHRVVTPSGEIRWQHWTDRAIFDEQGRLVEYQSVGRDITERKRAEEEIRQRNQELAALNAIATTMMQSALDLDEVLQRVADGVVEGLGCNTAVILLLDEKEGVFKGGAVSTRGKIIERINAIIGFPLVRIKFPARSDFNEAVSSALEGRIAIKHDLYELVSPVLSKPVCFALQKLLGSRTFLGLPLLAKGKVVGGIFASTREEEISEGYKETIMTFANQAAIAIENARLHEETKQHTIELEQRAKRLAVISRVSAAISSFLDWNEVLDTTVRELVGLFGVEHSGILIFDREKEWGHVLAEYPDWGATAERFQVKGYLAAERIIADQKPLMIEDTLKDPLVARVRDTMRRLGIKSMLIVPLVVKGETIGSIGLDAKKQRVFSQEEIELAQTIANQAAIAIRNVQLFQAEREQRDRAEALEEAAAVVSSTLDPDQVLDRVLEQVSRVVPNDATNVMLIEGDQARIVRWRGYERFGAEEFISTLVFHIHEMPGLQQMVESGEPMVIPDTDTCPDWVRIPVTEWLRSYAAAPIIVRGEVIGFLNVDSATPGFFTQAHAEALRVFADHAAAAIENARLYEAERRRSAELETLRQASLHLTSALELQPILEAILNHAFKLVAADDVHIFLYDSERLTFGAALWENGSQQESYAEPRPQGLTYTVARSGERIVVPNVNRHPIFRDYQWGGSIVGLPLRIGERVVGVMNVAFERPHVFDESELRVLGLLADQAAIAIENARLFEEEKRRSTQLAIISEVGEKAASILDSDRLMQEVTRSIQESFNYYNVILLLLDEERREVVMQAVAGGFEHLIPGEYRQSLDEGIIGFVARTGDSWLSNDTSKDPYYVKGFLGEVLTKSELCVPIKLDDEVIGALDVQSIRLNDFDQSDTVAMEAVADRVAIAIENARLYEETRQRALQLQTVEEVGRRVSSILDLDELFPYVAQAIQQNFGYYHVDIFLIEPATGYAVFKASSDPAAEKVWREQGLRFKIGEEGMIGWVAHTGDPFLANDVSQEPRYFLDEWLPETKSELVVPLKVEERVVGMLDVNSDKLNAFGEDDLFVLQTLASQVAIAIENARLFEETEHLKAFNESVVQGMAEGILIEDAQGIFTFANPAAEELLGYTREELIGQHWTTIVPEDKIEKVQQELAKWPRGTSSRYETALLSKEGQVIPIIVSGQPLFEEGKFVSVLSVFTDIRERVRSEREIEERRLYLEGVLGAAPDAIVTLDAHHRIVEWNAGAERLFGYSREEAIGQNLDDLITGPEVFEEAVGFTQVVLGGGEVPPTEAVRYRKDGSPMDVLLAGSPILVGDEFIGLVAVYTDITARVRMEETLRALALVDELTGLYNRRGFFTLSQQQLKTANRAKRKMLLLFTDFDGLKLINDAFGHSEGDRALIETADILRETFRESDIIARIGGDEFVVLAAETGKANANAVITRLQENLEARNAKGDRRYELSLSAGIAYYDPESPCSIDELLAQADRAMYERKQGDHQ